MNEVITQETALKRQQALSLYEKAKYAVAQYESIDDVLEYSNKAAAIEEYAKRANDREMAVKVGKARVRAERRCGELLLEMKGSGLLRQGGNPVINREQVESLLGSGASLNDVANVIGCSESAIRRIKKQLAEGYVARPHTRDGCKTIKELGLTNRQSAVFQGLAGIPEDEFEEILTTKNHLPCGDSIYYGRNKQQAVTTAPIPQQAIEYYAQLKQFKKHVLDEVTMSDSLADMSDEMRQESEQILQQMRAWLGGKNEKEC